MCLLGWTRWLGHESKFQQKTPVNSLLILKSQSLLSSIEVKNQLLAYICTTLHSILGLEFVANWWIVRKVQVVQLRLYWSCSFWTSKRGGTYTILISTGCTTIVWDKIHTLWASRVIWANIVWATLYFWSLKRNPLSDILLPILRNEFQPRWHATLACSLSWLRLYLFTCGLALVHWPFILAHPCTIFFTVLPWWMWRLCWDCIMNPSTKLGNVCEHIRFESTSRTQATEIRTEGYKPNKNIFWISRKLHVIVQ